MNVYSFFYDRFLCFLLLFVASCSGFAQGKVGQVVKTAAKVASSVAKTTGKTIGKSASVGRLIPEFSSAESSPVSAVAKSQLISTNSDLLLLKKDAFMPTQFYQRQIFNLSTPNLPVHSLRMNNKWTWNDWEGSYQSANYQQWEDYQRTWYGQSGREKYNTVYWQPILEKTIRVFLDSCRYEESHSSSYPSLTWKDVCPNGPASNPAYLQSSFERKLGSVLLNLNDSSKKTNIEELQLGLSVSLNVNNCATDSVSCTFETDSSDDSIQVKCDSIQINGIRNPKNYLPQ